MPQPSRRYVAEGRGWGKSSLQCGGRVWGGHFFAFQIWNGYEISKAKSHYRNQQNLLSTIKLSNSHPVAHFGPVSHFCKECPLYQNAHPAPMHIPTPNPLKWGSLQVKKSRIARLTELKKTRQIMMIRSDSRHLDHPGHPRRHYHV